MKFFLLFFLSIAFFLIPYSSGSPDSPEPPDWTLHRNSGFFHNLGRTSTMLHDWIFSKKSVANPDANRYQSTTTKPRSVSLPLYGSVHATAYWFADVYFGSPQLQIQSLIIDTGSSVMGFPCSDCGTRCGSHIDRPFNLSSSHSIKPVECSSSCPVCAQKRTPTSLTMHLQQCAYHVRYTEGSSLAGSWYEDKVTLNHNPFADPSGLSVSVSIPFGCHSEETHLFLSQDASGILGLEATSRFGPAPFVTSVLADLLDLKKVQGGSLRDLGLSGDSVARTQTEPVFAMCLSQSGGILTIGDSNTDYHSPNETMLSRSQRGWTQPERNPQYYSQQTQSSRDPSLITLLPQVPPPRSVGFDLPSSPTIILSSNQYSNGFQGWKTTNNNLDRTSVLSPTSTRNQQSTHPPLEFQHPAVQSTTRVEPVWSRYWNAVPTGSHQSFNVESMDQLSSSVQPRWTRNLFEDSSERKVDFEMASLNIEQSEPAGEEVKQAIDALHRQAEAPQQVSSWSVAPLDRRIQWTPLVVDPDEEGGWPGSYVAIVQGWRIRGAAFGETTLAVPYSPQAQRTRTSQAFGLPALIDSGTTLTYLPFVLYANLWTILLKNVAAAKRVRRRLMEQNEDSFVEATLIRRISGVTLSKMKERLEAYVDRLKRETEKERRLGRQMRETTTQRRRHESRMKELRMAEDVKREMHAAHALLQSDDEELEQQPSGFDDPLNSGRDATKRIFSEIKNSDSVHKQKEGQKRSPEISDKNDYHVEPSASPLRRLAPVSVHNLDEECWYLSKQESDLNYFPDMLLQFANHVEYLWRPSSYLYKKGKTKVYCLTIVSEETASSDDQRTLEESKRKAQPANPNKQAVFGSSFFINHDLVFHLGRWELASIESKCPSTDLEKRKKE